MLQASYNFVEIDLQALLHNFVAIKSKVGSAVEVMAIVKADAYGHGLVRCAQTLWKAGARVFGVAEVEEGIRLREAGVQGEILVLLGAPEEAFPEVIHYGLLPVVFDRASLKALSTLGEKQGMRVGVHLKVDTGMGRLGILPEQVPGFVETVKNLPGIFLHGVLSHFPRADEPQSPATMQQCENFAHLLSWIDGEIPGQRINHIANSAAIFLSASTHFDMVRPGISLYGYPSEDDWHSSLGFQPVMSFRSRVLQVKDVPAGFGVSYGHEHVTGRPSKLAVLPVGYDDGYLRRLSNRGQVLIRGVRAPVCGRVCMNACVVDVTDVPDIEAGDEVVLLGRQGNAEISAREVARWLDTITYEVLCLFGGKNRREYRE